MLSKYAAFAAGALVAVVLGSAAVFYWLGQGEPEKVVMAHATPEVRDSAGIWIVENPRVREGELPEWGLSADPVLRIGSVEGTDEAYLLNGVRHGTVLSDGSIAVSNAGPAEVRIFDREGRFARRVGRPGDGPGEFASVQRIVELAPDTLAVQDHALRVNFFGPDGRILSTLPGPFHPGRANPSGLAGTHWIWIGDSHFLVVGNTSSTWPDRSVWRPPVGLTLWDRERPDVSRSLGEFPGSEQFRANDDGPLWDFPMVIPLFGRRTLWEPGVDRVYVAETGTDEVLIFDLDGRLARIVRMDALPLPVTDEDREAAIRKERDARHNAVIIPPDLRGEFERVVERIPAPDHHPPITALREDREGYLWVRRPGHADDTEHVWEVFDRDGVGRASVRIPATLMILELGENYVLGVRTDELDVEFVELYGLER